MSVINNSVAPRLGICFMYPCAGMIERIGPDWDWIWLDAQHGQMGYRDVISLVRACDLIDRPAYVRVAGHEPGRIGQILDMDVAGVIVPSVETPQEAEALVRAAKLPPLGRRSYGGRRVIDRRSRDYFKQANERAMLIVQIETPTGIENVESIAEVPGVDALFFGPDDMRLRRGFAMDAPPGEDILKTDLERMILACRNSGKKAVTVAVTPGMLTLAGTLGVDLVVGDSDCRLLADGSRRRSLETRRLYHEAAQTKTDIVERGSDVRTAR